MEAVASSSVHLRAASTARHVPNAARRVFRTALDARLILPHDKQRAVDRQRGAKLRKSHPLRATSFGQVQDDRFKVLRRGGPQRVGLKGTEFPVASRSGHAMVPDPQRRVRASEALRIVDVGWVDDQARTLTVEQEAFVAQQQSGFAAADRAYQRLGRLASASQGVARASI